jgi:SOS-response transcriptional repressor LexA
MNDVRKALLNLSTQKDITSMGLRELARELGVKNPQTIKYHLQKIAIEQGVKERASVQIEKNKLGISDLIRIPIKGRVSAGPATQVADDVTSGYIRISSNLLKSRNYKDLYALIVSGTSMNMAKVEGKPINDGDYAIVDSSKRSPTDGQYVIAQVDNLANLKKLHLDVENEQVVLLSESSEDYQPIFIHPDDNNENLIMGTVIQVIRQPNFA